MPQLTTTVRFAKVDHNLKLRTRVYSIVNQKTLAICYGEAMTRFIAKMTDNPTPVDYINTSTPEYGSARVEKVDNEIYKSFKITCIQKDISISQGINLALEDWLERQRNDNSGLEIKT